MDQKDAHIFYIPIDVQPTVFLPFIQTQNIHNHLLSIAYMPCIYYMQISISARVLLVSGLLEERIIGPSKVYYISQKLPLNAMLDVVDDYIVVINSEKKLFKLMMQFLIN